MAGGPFLIDLVAAASERGETEVAEALGVLQERDLVRPTEASRRFRFRHPFLRRAIHDAVPRVWRLGAHELLAQALEERGGPRPGGTITWCTGCAAR